MRYFLIIFFLLGIYACNTPDKKNPTSETTKQNTEQTPANTPSKNVDAVDIGGVMTPYLKAAEKIEFQFYEQGISSETESKQQIANFLFFVSPENATITKCDFDGGIVFKNAAGDIIMTMDYALKQACTFVKVTADGKSYYQKLTADGVKFLGSMSAFKAEPGMPAAK
ncbi:MAG: hypothetical protein R2798_07680 [Chitinophagales bacterium]|nr:hypothetical protein [Bacteroidota bacterium]MCB9042316.1 hypothetical protein [Chitinophagales bacterium]